MPSPPSSDFGSGSGSGSSVTDGSLSARIDRAAGRLQADQVLRRGSVLLDDPFADPTPFEDLLGKHHI